MTTDDEDYTEEDFEDSLLELDDFENWWEFEGASLSSTGDDQKDIAQSAWLAAYLFYTGYT
jgi:hypothetical protein